MDSTAGLKHILMFVFSITILFQFNSACEANISVRFTDLWPTSRQYEFRCHSKLYNVHICFKYNLFREFSNKCKYYTKITFKCIWIEKKIRTLFITNIIHLCYLDFLCTTKCYNSTINCCSEFLKNNGITANIEWRSIQKAK